MSDPLSAQYARALAEAAHYRKRLAYLKADLSIAKFVALLLLVGNLIQLGIQLLVP